MGHSFDYRRFYDCVAPVYAWGQVVLPVWRHYTEAALPWVPKGGIVLEIGPGPGLLLAQLAASCTLALGLDLSPRMLAQCQRRLQRLGHRAALIQGHATRIPLAAASVDAVVTTFAFSAFPDGAGAMGEMARVLRPGGRVVLVDAGVPSDGNRIGCLLARLWERFGDHMRDEAALMSEAKLTVVERREFGAYRGIRLVVGQKDP